MIGIFSGNDSITFIPNWAVWLILGVIVAVILTFYLLRSFGLYTMAKRVGENKPFLAFIPIGWIWLACGLAKDIRFFGAQIKKANLIFLITVGIINIISITGFLLAYVPLIGYFLEGGEILLSSVKVTAQGMKEYDFIGGIYVGTDFYFAYSQGYLTAVRVFAYATTVLDLVNIVMLICIYAAFFRRYWPQHFFAGVVFSVFGLFPIFAFALRNRTPMGYDEYVKEKMKQYEQVNRQTVNGRQDQFSSGEPFQEMNKKNDQPFSDFFNDDKKDN